VGEADLKGFFDSREPDWRIRRLAERSEDRALLGLMRQGLEAGIWATTGAILHPVTGTPQGGVVSPVLSTVDLHYGLDLWCEKGLKPPGRGEACLLRDAEEYICACESQEEAERC
jgi:RNA-directed DNA polymerase